jgi:hypothetical protein
LNSSDGEVADRPRQIVNLPEFTPVDLGRGGPRRLPLVGRLAEKYEMNHLATNPWTRWLVIDAGEPTGSNGEPRLLAHFASGGVKWRFVRLGKAARKLPIEHPVGVLHQQDSPLRIEYDRRGAQRLPGDGAHRLTREAGPETPRCATNPLTATGGI